MNGFNSAITVPAEGLSSQPGGPDPNQLGCPQNYNQRGKPFNTPYGQQLPQAQKPRPRPKSPDLCRSL